MHILGGILFGFALADLARQDPALPLWVDLIFIFGGLGIVLYQAKLYGLFRTQEEARVLVDSRDKYFAAIAGILENQAFVISRGKRESVKVGDTYKIWEGSETLALLRVFKVEEKMALARPIWKSKNCPIVKYGTRLQFVENAEAEAKLL